MEEKKEKKISPWPWKCVKGKSYYNLGVVEHYYDLWEIKNANDKVIAKLKEINDHDDFEMDAALMTAAPELREELEKLVKRSCSMCAAEMKAAITPQDKPCEDGRPCPYGLDGARKAIDKSYGRE